MKYESKLKALLIMLILIITNTGSVLPLAPLTRVEAQQQPTQMWSRTWGGSTFDDGKGVAVYGDDIYISGETSSYGAGAYDAFLAKFDADGNQLWNTTWGGPSQEYNRGVAVEGGYIYIIGSERSFGAVEFDAFLAKFDADGNQLWNKSWGRIDRGEYGYGVAIEGSNIYIIVRTLPWSLVKYDVDGNQLWNRTWGGTNWDQGNGVAVEGGYIYITGKTRFLSTEPYDAFLVKYDADGNLLWDTTWGGPLSDSGEGVCVEGNDIYIVGKTNSFGAGGGDAFLAKFDVDGNLLWDTTWGGLNVDHGYSVGVGSGDVYMTGYTESFGAGQEDVFLAKYDVDGNLVWNAKWGGADWDVGYGVAVDGRDIYITGETSSFGAGRDDAFLVKYGSLPSLEAFPYPFVDEVLNLEATFIYGQSDEHGPSHGAWTIDVAGGTLVASTLGRESDYGLPEALIDVRAAVYDDYQVYEVTALGNLITLGGGDVNLVSRYYEFLEVDGHYALPVGNIYDDYGWAVGIYSRHSDTSYYKQGEYGQGGQVIDYAFAALYLDGDRYVLYVAGITGFTTKAMCKVLAEYQSYSLSGVAVILQFTDNDGDGTFEGIDTIESIPSGWAG